ncbi:MAG: hypothetical protein WDW38_008799 [Sanguina aurantia]
MLGVNFGRKNSLEAAHPGPQLANKRDPSSAAGWCADTRVHRQGAADIPRWGPVARTRACGGLCEGANAPRAPHMCDV